MDLQNFKYFKYPKTTAKPFYFKSHGTLYSIRRIPDPPTKLEDAVNRVTSAGTYFKHLAFGNPAERIKSKLVLDPEFGSKWSHKFQSKHGKFGEKLVELLGSGGKHEEVSESEFQ